MVDTWGFSFHSTADCTRTTPVPLEEFQAAFDRHIANVVDAERFGFDGWAWAEHHFHPSSNSPSPHLLVATVAAKTKTLRLSVHGSVLCLHDGRRHAEEVGMLDYLTHGRFEPGIAPGAGDLEARLAGLDPSDIRPRYYSAAEFLHKAIGARTITHQDSFTSVTDLQMIPPLRPELASKTWVTVLSPDSAAWTARHGFKLVTGWMPAEVSAQLAETYRAAAREHGQCTDPKMLGLRRRVFVAETDSEAQEKYEAAVDVIASLATLEMADPKVMARRMHPDDFAIGSPNTVADKLIAQCELGGYGNLLAFTDFAEFEPADLVRSHELIGSQVAPQLKRANVARPSVAAA